MKIVGLSKNYDIKSKEYPKNVQKYPIHLLERLHELAATYKAPNGRLTEYPNIEEDLEFVKETIRQFATPEKIVKFPYVHVRKQGKPLRIKRSTPSLCVGTNCKEEKLTEADFNNLELQAEELMHQLEDEYDSLKMVDQNIVHEINNQG